MKKAKLKLAGASLSVGLFVGALFGLALGDISASAQQRSRSRTNQSDLDLFLTGGDQKLAVQKQMLEQARLNGATVERIEKLLAELTPALRSLPEKLDASNRHLAKISQAASQND